MKAFKYTVEVVKAEEVKGVYKIKAFMYRDGEKCAVYEAEDDAATIAYVTQREEDMFSADTAAYGKRVYTYTNGAGQASEVRYSQDVDYDYDGERSYYQQSYFGTPETPMDRLVDLVSDALLIFTVKALCRKNMVWRAKGKGLWCYRMLPFISSVPKVDQLRQLKERHSTATIFNFLFLNEEAA